jgi:hypothetical protein
VRKAIQGERRESLNKWIRPIEESGGLNCDTTEETRHMLGNKKGLSFDERVRKRKESRRPLSHTHQLLHLSLPPSCLFTTLFHFTLSTTKCRPGSAKALPFGCHEQVAFMAELRSPPSSRPHRPASTRHDSSRSITSQWPLQNGKKEEKSDGRHRD